MAPFFPLRRNSEIEWPPDALEELKVLLRGAMNRRASHARLERKKLFEPGFDRRLKNAKELALQKLEAKGLFSELALQKLEAKGLFSAQTKQFASDLMRERSTRSILQDAAEETIYGPPPQPASQTTAESGPARVGQVDLRHLISQHANRGVLSVIRGQQQAGNVFDVEGLVQETSALMVAELQSLGLYDPVTKRLAPGTATATETLNTLAFESARKAILEVRSQVGAEKLGWLQSSSIVHAGAGGSSESETQNLTEEIVEAGPSPLAEAAVRQQRRRMGLPEEDTSQVATSVGLYLDPYLAKLEKEGPLGSLKSVIFRLHLGQRVFEQGQPPGCLPRTGPSNLANAYQTSKAYQDFSGEYYRYYKATGSIGLKKRAPMYHGPLVPGRAVTTPRDKEARFISMEFTDEGPLALVEARDGQYYISGRDLSFAPCPTCAVISRFISVPGLTPSAVQQTVEDILNEVRERGLTSMEKDESLEDF